MCLYEGNALLKYSSYKKLNEIQHTQRNFNDQVLVTRNNNKKFKITIINSNSFARKAVKTIEKLALLAIKLLFFCLLFLILIFFLILIYFIC